MAKRHLNLIRMDDTFLSATLRESHGANRSQGLDCKLGYSGVRFAMMGLSTSSSLMFVGIVVFVLSFVVMFDLSGVGFSVDRHNEFCRGIRSVQIACQFFILQGKA